MKSASSKQVIPAFTSSFSSKFFSTTTILNERKRDPGLDITGQATYPREIPGPEGLPSRHEQIRKLSSTTPDSPYDILIIGGGATGAGVAFDAASRDGNLKVACIERGDFASETSSRSTKLIWAGIRYVATMISLLRQNSSFLCKLAHFYYIVST